MAWLDYDGLLYFWQKIKAKLNDKVDKVEGKGLSSNDFTAAEKNKLAGIEAGANNYSHPTSAGNKHIPAGGQSGQILRWSGDGSATWGPDYNTTYSDFKAATASAAGWLWSGSRSGSWQAGSISAWRWYLGYSNQYNIQ